MKFNAENEDPLLNIVKSIRFPKYCKQLQYFDETMILSRLPLWNFREKGFLKILKKTSKAVILSENSCHFVNLLSFVSSSFSLSMKKIM